MSKVEHHYGLEESTHKMKEYDLSAFDSLLFCFEKRPNDFIIEFTNNRISGQVAESIMARLIGFIDTFRKEYPHLDTKAHATKHITVLLEEHYPDGDRGFLTTCRDYETYEKLPQVVSYKNTPYSKTGWNSDSRVAYYKTGEAIAYVK